MKKNPISKEARAWLEKEQWEFSTVPEEQIKSCFLYEYAREKLRRSDDLRVKLESWNQGMVDFDLWKAFSSPIGHAILTPTMMGEPWIKYIERVRKKCGSKWNFEALEKDHKSPGSAAFFTDSIDSMELLTKWNDAQKVDTSEFEFGCFCIDWNHPDAAIKEAFNRWLDNRSRLNQMPEEAQEKEVLRMASPMTISDIFKEEKQEKKTSNRKCKYSNRGKSLRDDMARYYLKNLGAFRLRILGKIDALNAAMCYAEQNTQDGKGIFADSEDWYQSESRVADILKKLFPE